MTLREFRGVLAESVPDVRGVSGRVGEIGKFPGSVRTGRKFADIFRHVCGDCSEIERGV